MSFKKCNYSGCSNNKRTSDRKFYKFPKSDPDRLQKWIDATGNLNLREYQPVQLAEMSICEDHFDESAFSNPTHVRVNRNAVPKHFNMPLDMPSTSPGKSPEPITESMEIPQKQDTPSPTDSFYVRTPKRTYSRKVLDRDGGTSALPLFSAHSSLSHDHSSPQPPAKFQKTEAEPFDSTTPSLSSGPCPPMAGSSKLHLSRPLPSDTVQFLCKVVNKDEDFGETYEISYSRSSIFVKMSVKYCVVPNCNNTTATAQGKNFFNVPTGERRVSWSLAIKEGTNQSRFNLARTILYSVCEDHFVLENDVENWLRYKLVGGRLSLRKHVLPHLFSPKRQVERSQLLSPDRNRKRKIGFIEECNTSKVSKLSVVPDGLSEIESTSGISQIANATPAFRNASVQASPTLVDPAYVPSDSETESDGGGESNDEVQLAEMSICEDHFDESAFGNPTHVRLNRNAVPKHFNMPSTPPGKSPGPLTESMEIPQEQDTPSPSDSFNVRTPKRTYSRKVLDRGGGTSALPLPSARSSLSRDHSRYRLQHPEAYEKEKSGKESAQQQKQQQPSTSYVPQPPAKFQKTEAEPFDSATPSLSSGPCPPMAGSSKLHLPRPLPSDTDQFLCKVENEDEDFEEKYEISDSSTTVHDPDLLNSASMLVHEPNSALTVPLPATEHTAIKQETHDDGKTPSFVDPNDSRLSRFPRAPGPVPGHEPHELKGHRIVDIGYLLQWCMDLKVDHLRNCPETNLKLINEINDGLRSDFVFHCDKCNFYVVKSSMNEETSPSVINRFYQWKSSMEMSTWVLAKHILKIFSIPFKG